MKLSISMARRHCISSSERFVQEVVVPRQKTDRSTPFRRDLILEIDPRGKNTVNVGYFSVPPTVLDKFQRRKFNLFSLF